MSNTETERRQAFDRYVSSLVCNMDESAIFDEYIVRARAVRLLRERDKEFPPGSYVETEREQPAEQYSEAYGQGRRYERGLITAMLDDAIAHDTGSDENCEACLTALRDDVQNDHAGAASCDGWPRATEREATAKRRAKVRRLARNLGRRQEQRRCLAWLKLSLEQVRSLPPTRLEPDRTTVWLESLVKRIESEDWPDHRPAEPSPTAERFDDVEQCSEAGCYNMAGWRVAWQPGLSALLCTNCARQHGVEV